MPSVVWLEKRARSWNPVILAKKWREIVVSKLWGIIICNGFSKKKKPTNGTLKKHTVPKDLRNGGIQRPAERTGSD